jgi:hypothetical protein
VRDDLGAALGLGVDGSGLKVYLRQLAGHDAVLLEKNIAGSTVFAAKDVEVSFRPDEFDGNFEAAQLIQSVMRSSRVDVELMGNVMPATRTSLLYLAAQGLKHRVQAFGVDGVDGKYVVPLQLADLPDVYRASAVAVTRESARAGLSRWSMGLPVGHLDEWVPETTQRLLASGLSLIAAQAVIESLDSPVFDNHADQIGAHGFASLLKSQGFDVSSPTIEEQALSLGLITLTPNQARGQYFGVVMGLDHRAALVKVARTDALELPFRSLQAGHARPDLGDKVQMSFKNGVLTVGVTERSANPVVGR